VCTLLEETSEMTYLIIGSTALYRHIGGRVPKDLDVFTDNPVRKTDDDFWHPSFHGIWGPNEERYATLDELYSIKMSHTYWSLKNGSWEKHVFDLIRMKEAGAKLDLGIHKILYDVWTERYGAKRVDLDMDKADFFDDAVPRTYDHDSVHYSVAYGDHPMYEDFLKDGEEIMMDMKKIWAAPFEDQVRLFREEIYATALERKVIPSNYTASPHAAYAWALKRTITSLTKGKSARFIAENLDIFRKPDVDYVQRHKDQAHKLIPFERTN
jgi:hypothetical protein